MKNFKNKYRGTTTRLQHYNYGQNGAYFITICCHNKSQFFGKIIEGKMILNDLGKIALKEWIITPEIRPDMNLFLGEFVIMPDHFHAILIIGLNNYNSQTENINGIETINFIHKTNEFAPQSKNLASVVRGFKSSVTMKGRQINPEFKWQRKYHDHVIRNNTSFRQINKYIIENPMKTD